MVQASETQARKSKVAIFHFSAPPNTSGVDNIIRDHARLFRLHKYKVDIVAGIGKQFRKDIPVHVIKKINPRHPLTLAVTKELEQGVVSAKYNKLERSLYNVIKKYITKNEVDVCILHNLFSRTYNLPLTSAFARLVKDMPQVKFITWVHDVVYYEEPDTHLKRELGEKHPWSLMVKPVRGLIYVCVSNFLKDNLMAAFKGADPTKITVIPNGHDIEKFFGLSPIMRALYHDINGLHSDLVACIPVRAIPRKNLDLALRIAKAFIKRGVKFKLLLTANVDYKRERNLKYYEHLKHVVRQLGMTRNVFFLEEYFKKFATPKKPAPAIPVSELFLISDFLLFTSRVEGFGLPILEGGLMRTPIFATDIPTLREIGTTNINYFKAETNPDDIAAFILECLKEMPQAYFYRKIIKKFSLRTTFQKRIIHLVEN